MTKLRVTDSLHNQYILRKIWTDQKDFRANWTPGTYYCAPIRFIKSFFIAVHILLLNGSLKALLLSGLLRQYLSNQHAWMLQCKDFQPKRFFLLQNHFSERENSKECVLLEMQLPHLSHKWRKRAEKVLIILGKCFILTADLWAVIKASLFTPVSAYLCTQENRWAILGWVYCNLISTM